MEVKPGKAPTAAEYWGDPSLVSETAHDALFDEWQRDTETPAAPSPAPPAGTRIVYVDSRTGRPVDAPEPTRIEEQPEQRPGHSEYTLDTIF